MMNQSNENRPSPPGVLATIAAGFEVATAHWWLLLIPVLLDSFYWLGPRLSAQQMILRLVSFVQGEEMLTGVLEQLAELAPRTNLFTSLSVPLLGVPGLMGGFIMPEQTPLDPARIEVTSPLLWLLLLLGLSAAGLIVGALYFGLIAQAVRAETADEDNDGRIDFARFRQRLPVYLGRYLGLGLFFFISALLIYVPLSFMAIIASIFSPIIASIVILMGPLLLLWFALYLAFSIHGVLFGERPLLSALLESIRLVQFNWPQVIGLFLVVILGINLLDGLWLAVDSGNWLTLFSIVGHGFVTTGLVTATFIFYRDRYAMMVALYQQQAETANLESG